MSNRKTLARALTTRHKKNSSPHPATSSATTTATTTSSSSAAALSSNTPSRSFSLRFSPASLLHHSSLRFNNASSGSENSTSHSRLHSSTSSPPSTLPHISPPIELISTTNILSYSAPDVRTLRPQCSESSHPPVSLIVTPPTGPLSPLASVYYDNSTSSLSSVKSPASTSTSPSCTSPSSDVASPTSSASSSSSSCISRISPTYHGPSLPAILERGKCELEPQLSKSANESVTTCASNSSNESSATFSMCPDSSPPSISTFPSPPPSPSLRKCWTEQLQMFQPSRSNGQSSGPINPTESGATESSRESISSISSPPTPPPRGEELQVNCEKRHPFSQEIAQLDRVAMELNNTFRTAEYYHDIEYLRQNSLARFSAADYSAEIEPLWSMYYLDGKTFSSKRDNGRHASKSIDGGGEILPSQSLFRRYSSTKSMSNGFNAALARTSRLSLLGESASVPSLVSDETPSLSSSSKWI